MIGSNQGIAILLKEFLETLRTIEIKEHYSNKNSENKEIKKVLLESIFNEASIPLISNKTGTWCEGGISTPSYWINHSTETLNFSKVLDTVLEECQNSIILQLGSGSLLSKLLRQIKTGKKGIKIFNLVKRNFLILD